VAHGRRNEKWKDIHVILFEIRPEFGGQFSPFPPPGGRVWTWPGRATPAIMEILVALCLRFPLTYGVFTWMPLPKTHFL
jgi:hypothetical protein